MNYGMYLSAASMRIGQNRMDVLANNMANVNTTSFKRDQAVVRSRMGAPEENNIPSDLVIPVLDDLAGGSGTGGVYTDFSQGSLQHTQNDWDVALLGEGFFRVLDDNGQLSYTRDGRLEVVNGKLVTASDGFAVLDENGQQMQVPAGRPVISADGSVQVGEYNGKIGIVDFQNPHLLIKQGKNCYKPAEGAGLMAAGGTQIKQGYVEGSGVDPTETLVEMINVQRAYEASAKMIQFTDTMLGRAVNDIATLA